MKGQIDSAYVSVRPWLSPRDQQPQLSPLMMVKDCGTTRTLKTLRRQPLGNNHPVQWRPGVLWDVMDPIGCMWSSLQFVVQLWWLSGSTFLLDSSIHGHPWSMVILFYSVYKWCQEDRKVDLKLKIAKPHMKGESSCISCQCSNRTITSPFPAPSSFPRNQFGCTTWALCRATWLHGSFANGATVARALIAWGRYKDNPRVVGFDIRPFAEMMPEGINYL